MPENEKHQRNTDDQDTVCFTLPEQEQHHQNQQQYGGYQQPYQNQQQYDSYQQPYQNQQQYGGYQQSYQNQQQYGGYQQPYQNQQQYGGYQQPYQNQQQYGGYQQPYQSQGGYYPPPTAPKKKKKKPANRKPSPAPVQMPVQKPKKKKHRKSFIAKLITRILLSLLTVFLILFGIYSCTSLSLIGKMNQVSTGDRTRTSNAMSRSYVRSVLVIGTDGRSEDERGRSDSMILISLNRKTNKLYMTSFMRDCNVEIPGYGENKLNAAYSFGGPELLMDTIEKNFRVKIDDYIQINFSTFASVIDAAGGIDMEISDAEAESINVILISEVNELMGDERESDLLQSGGKLHLSGKQALSYSRIRNVGNYDFERTNRQRKVITELIKKARSGGISFIRKVAKNSLPSITTNMSTGSLYLLSLRLPFLLGYDTEQLQIPADGTFSDDPYNSNGWVIVVDFDANHQILEDTVFSRK